MSLIVVKKQKFFASNHGELHTFIISVGNYDIQREHWNHKELSFCESLALNYAPGTAAPETAAPGTATLGAAAPGA